MFFNQMNGVENQQTNVWSSIWYKYCFSIRWMVLRINRLMFGLLSDRFMRKSKNQSIYVIWLSNKIFDEKTEYQSVDGLLAWFGVLGSWKCVVMVPVFRLFYRLYYILRMMEKLKIWKFWWLNSGSFGCSYLIDF